MIFLRILSFFLLSLVLLSGCSSNPPLIYDNLANRDGYKEEVLTNIDGLKLFTRVWPVTEPAKGNVIILHASAMHGGIYSDLAEYLVENGYRVYAPDMQSWGRSQGVKGHGYVESFDAYAVDVKQLLQLIRKRHPGEKNYLMWESLGGTVAMYTALKYEFLLNGVITSGVGYNPSMKVLGLRAPEFINDMGRAAAEWMYSGLSSVPAVESDMGLLLALEDDDLEDRLMNDPYVAHDWLPGAYVSTVLAASDYIDKNKRHLTIPVFLIHGKDDILVPWYSSRDLFENVSSTSKDMKVYDSPHAVLLERKWREAAKDIVAFLDRHE